MQQEKAKRRSRGEDYVNNKEFSQLISEHVEGVRSDLSEGREPRPLTNHIGECFLKIANGLSRSPNFMNYSYREDMVMDAVENCIKAVNNYKYDAPTRSGNANAFSYFTQISYFAFLRRIAKEKKQGDIKKLLIESGNVCNFAEFGDGEENYSESLIEKVRQKNDAFYMDENVEQKPSAKRKSKTIIDKVGALDDFMV
jgi:hypothetical protein